MHFDKDSFFSVITPCGLKQPWRWQQYIPPKLLYQPVSSYGVTTRKTNAYMFTAIRNLNVISDCTCLSNALYAVFQSLKLLVNAWFLFIEKHGRKCTHKAKFLARSYLLRICSTPSPISNLASKTVKKSFKVTHNRGNFYIQTHYFVTSEVFKAVKTKMSILRMWCRADCILTIPFRRKIPSSPSGLISEDGVSMLVQNAGIYLSLHGVTTHRCALLTSDVLRGKRKEALILQTGENTALNQWDISPK